MKIKITLFLLMLAATVTTCQYIKVKELAHIEYLHGMAQEEKNERDKSFEVYKQMERVIPKSKTKASSVWAVVDK